MTSKMATVHSAVFCNNDSQYIQPVLIYFSGTRLPRHLLGPIVSVTVAPEYRPFISPTVGVVPEQDVHCNSELLDPQRTIGGHATTVTNSDDIHISFLPLPSAFGPLEHKHWASLCASVQQWLVSTPDWSQHWAWGRDIFWLAFVAAFPDFPAGKWPVWDPRIPAEGTFIEGWMGGSLVDSIIGDAGEDKNVHERIRLWVWDEFCRVAPLFYPYSLTAEL